MKTSLKLTLLNVEDQGFHIFIKAYINGRVANLLVDTGASKTVFDTNRIGKFAELKSMQKNENISTGLGTNSMKGHTILIKKMQIGLLKLNNYEAFLLDLSHVNDTYAKLKYKELDGIIGGDILAAFHAVINYSAKTLVLNFKVSPKSKT